jgi:hypothetical protein
MLKIINTSFALCFILLLNAQTLLPINFIKNKLSVTKTVANKTTSSTSIGNMEINNNVNTVSIIAIKANPTNNDSAAIETTFAKIKMFAEAMGRKMEYDSDNPLTSTYAATEGLSNVVGSSVRYYINKNGLVTSIDTTQKISISPKLNLSQFGGFSIGADCNLYLNITKATKIGDTWTDSSFADNAKINKRYTYKSFKNGIAIVEYTSIIKISGETEQMGMKVKMKQQGTLNGVMTVNINNLLITSNKYISNISGTVEAAGQSMPSKLIAEVNETVD